MPQAEFSASSKWRAARAVIHRHHVHIMLLRKFPPLWHLPQIRCGRILLASRESSRVRERLQYTSPVHREVGSIDHGLVLGGESRQAAQMLRVAKPIRHRGARRSTPCLREAVARRSKPKPPDHAALDPALQRVVDIVVADVAPVTILNVNRQRGLAQLPHVLGQDAAASKHLQEDAPVAVPAGLQRGAKSCSKALYTR